MHEHFPLWSRLAYLSYIRAAPPLTGIVTLVLFVVAATVSTKPNGSMTRNTTNGMTPPQHKENSGCLASFLN